jgi:hypothetical protein
MNGDRVSTSPLSYLIIIGLLMTTTLAQAHLMAEQKGTLNFVNGGAFLVLSAPVSAFEGVDDNEDGALSAQELGRHLGEVKEQIYQQVQLLDDANTSLPLQGLLLSLVHLDDNPSDPAKQIMILGRFPVTENMSSLRLHILLQGKALNEQSINLSATRNGLSHKMTFRAENNFHALFVNADKMDR